MPRKPFTPMTEPVRKLKSAKIWLGIVWVPGDEHELPADFPQDGPWWDDWEDEPELTLAEQKRAFGIREDRLNPGEVPSPVTSSPQQPGDAGSPFIEGDPMQSDEQIEYEKQNSVGDALPRTSKQRKPSDPRRTRV